ncbi:hypothetical protein VSU16_14930 (plasmid) [Cetobacterium somerae]|uniref:hypothetical protein n=1 Tax=Cetobacterium somerae TaxID=188913 RepID=UPI002E7C09DB|nr:hypothetical protein [Cetobacterium somerae]WVJ03022.1 hypothetical protein VSU16_14930 [Cetobacterium somerae]
MKKNLLLNTLVKITSIKGLRIDLTNIEFSGKPKLIKQYDTILNLKKKPILDVISIIRYPIFNLHNSYNNISLIKFNKIHTTESSVILKFIPDFGPYNNCGYNKIILDNIEKIYARTSNYFNDVYDAFLKKYTIKAKENRLEFSEKIFDLVLYRINLKKINTYDEITDEMIVSILIDYFNSNM